MTGEETLNQLFEKARQAPAETNVNDVQKWIGLATIGAVLIGLLTKLNVVFTKTMIMYSAAILTVGIGFTTYIAFNHGNEKEKTFTKSAMIIKTEHAKEAPLPVQPVEEEQVANELYNEFQAQETEQAVQQQPEEVPVEALPTIPSTPLSPQTPLVKSIASGIRSEEKDYGSFSKIKLRDAVDVIVLQGSKESVRIEGDSDAQSRVEIKNSGGTLTINNAKTKGNIVNKKLKQKVYVTVVDISKIDCSGAIRLKSQGSLNLNKMELLMSGATNVELDLNLAELMLDLSGATDVKLYGQAKSMKLDCSGASTVEATGLQVKDAKIICSGANDTKIYITGNLDIDASGASTIKCKGNPVITKKTLSGGASFKELQ